MKRKWIVLTGVTLFLGRFAAVSAAAEQPGENAQERSRLEHLDLTDEQKARLQALRKQHGRTLRALRDTMAVLRERHREAVMDVLTDEQEAKLGPFDLQSELDVTPYNERIEAITESARNVGAAIGRWWDDMNDPENIERVYSKLNLTSEEKKKLAELAEAQREARQRLRQRLHNALEAVLDDEQREKLKKCIDEAISGGKR